MNGATYILIKVLNFHLYLFYPIYIDKWTSRPRGTVFMEKVGVATRFLNFDTASGSSLASVAMEMKLLFRTCMSKGPFLSW